jgi:thiazole synthase ThiGH ThiG subunit
MTGRYVPIITDGGMSKGGDVCKALACGSDAVMVGSAFARAKKRRARAIIGAWPRRTPTCRAAPASKSASPARSSKFFRPGHRG